MIIIDETLVLQGLYCHNLLNTYLYSVIEHIFFFHYHNLYDLHNIAESLLALRTTLNPLLIILYSFAEYFDHL